MRVFIFSLRWARLGRWPESYLFGEDCLSREVALHLGASFRAILIRGSGPGTPLAPRTGKMVLVPFAETKGTRRAGAKPRIKNWWAVSTLLIHGRNPFRAEIHRTTGSMRQTEIKSEGIHHHSLLVEISDIYRSRLYRHS